MDVPLIVLVPPFSQSEAMSTPGAYTWTHLPKLVKLAEASVLSEAATPRTPLAPDGEPLQASALSLPAATARNTPAPVSFFAALSMEVDLAPPRDMFATAGLAAC